MMLKCKLAGFCTLLNQNPDRKNLEFFLKIASEGAKNTGLIVSKFQEYFLFTSIYLKRFCPRVRLSFFFLKNYFPGPNVIMASVVPSSISGASVGTALSWMYC
ncbi:hypothetical protein XELAEV_18024458mg [Xenopus laevis]|uniref:Uncharacterized protein n=1 Tax=Xenopus laevis TaxID=8355 RepID=A0A974HLA9_XENLA|nr:hypothetical protein XELAEV_18024458mg [Xenopus laevis]